MKRSSNSSRKLDGLLLILESFLSKRTHFSSEQPSTFRDSEDKFIHKNFDVVTSEQQSSSSSSGWSWSSQLENQTSEIALEWRLSKLSWFSDFLGAGCGWEVSWAGVPQHKFMQLHKAKRNHGKEKYRANIRPLRISHRNCETISSFSSCLPIIKWPFKANTQFTTAQCVSTVSAKKINTYTGLELRIIVSYMLLCILWAQQSQSFSIIMRRRFICYTWEARKRPRGTNHYTQGSIGWSPTVNQGKWHVS